MITKFSIFLNESKKINNNYDIKNIWKYILYRAKKLWGFNKLGGKCVKCGDDNIFHATFHHKDKKDKSFGISFLKYANWKLVQEEFSKCEILCANCHAEHHYNESETTDSRRKTKEILINYAGGECVICGYGSKEGDSVSALSFHHKNEHDVIMDGEILDGDLVDKNDTKKVFSPGQLSLRINDASQIPQSYKDEINKCDLLCMNCHQEQHVDKEKYNKYKDEIIEKGKNPRYKKSKIDRQVILNLLNDGKNQAEISKELDIPKGTLSGIIKELINDGLYIPLPPKPKKIPTKKEIQLLRDKKMTWKQIAKEFKMRYQKNYCKDEPHSFSLFTSIN